MEKQENKNLENKKKSEIAYQGKMFEIVNFEAKPGVKHEIAVRAPGIRLLIEHKENNKLGLLMTRELRHDRAESSYDYRLPGGKIYDSLEEFNRAKEKNNNIDEDALKAAKLEGAQEAGVKSGEFNKIGVSRAGGSVEWDLHYFTVTNAVLGEQELEENEKGDIETIFLSAEDIFEKLKNKEIKEGRSADMIWSWLLKNDFIKFSE